MTRDDIIRIVQEANCGWTHNGTVPLLIGEAQIERFAALVAAAEREECAKVCEAFNSEPVSHATVAAAIRARGEK